VVARDVAISSHLDTNLSTDDDAMAAGGLLVDNLVIRLRVALVIGTTAAGATAVEEDAVAGAGDAVALARAGAGGAGDGAWAGAAGAGQRWDVRLVVGVILGVGLVKAGHAEAGGELVDGGLGAEMGSLDWVVWLWALNLRWRDTTATDNILGHAAGGALDLGGLGGWDIEDVELAAGGWLNNGCVSWVVGNVVPIHDVVVPVALTLLHGAT